MDLLARSLAAAALDRVDTVGTLRDADDIDAPQTMAATQIWVAVEGAREAALPIGTEERLRLAAALAGEDRDEIEQATAELLTPATTALTDSALLALSQGFGIGAQWVEEEMGTEARERFLGHLRERLLADE